MINKQKDALPQAEEFKSKENKRPLLSMEAGG
jgi:hypothetical protein